MQFRISFNVVIYFHSQADIVQLDVTWLFDDFGDSQWTGKVPQNLEVTSISSKTGGIKITKNKNKENQYNTAEFVMSSYNFSNSIVQAKVFEVNNSETSKLDERETSSETDLNKIKESGGEIRWSDMKTILENN